MNIWALTAVSVLYALTGVDFFLKGLPAWGIFWCSYAVANSAFMWATWK